jgi:hypothetical protein
MIAGSQSSPVPSPSRVDAICEKDGRENSSAKQIPTASLNAFMLLASVSGGGISGNEKRKQHPSDCRAKFFTWTPDANPDWPGLERPHTGNEDETCPHSTQNVQPPAKTPPIVHPIECDSEFSISVPMEPRTPNPGWEHEIRVDEFSPTRNLAQK